MGVGDVVDTEVDTEEATVLVFPVLVFLVLVSLAVVATGCVVGAIWTHFFATMSTNGYLELSQKHSQQSESLHEAFA